MQSYEDVPTFEEFMEARQGPTTKCSSLLDHDLDLWEHGSLLFAAFEFEAAAELFVQLSRSICDDGLYSTLCLLNAAITYARLGDFSRASQHLSEVEEVEELLPITLCLMGHVEYELGSLQKSQDCFNIALQAIDEDQPYDHLGLNYSLREEQIQQNLDFLVKDSALGMVGTIPADVLFEAPPRKGSSIRTECCDAETWPIHSTAALRPSSSLPTITPLRPGHPTCDTEAKQILDQSSTHSSGLHATPSLMSIIPELFSRLAIPKPSTKAWVAARCVKLRADSKRVLAKKPSRKISPNEAVVIKPMIPLEVNTSAKKFSHLQARDARPGRDRTGDLDHFIKQLPQETALVARDARGRPGSVSNLAQFFRGTEPTDTRAPVASSQESEGSASQAQTGATPGTTPLSISSSQQDCTPRLAKVRPSPPESLYDSHKRPFSELSRKPMIELQASATNDSSCQSREEIGPGLPKAERSRPQPQAIHPALRAGFSLDHQEDRGMRPPTMAALHGS